jgi:hypothetical protein
MSDIVNELAEKSGISPEQAKKGLGAVLSYVKESMGEDTFSQIHAAVPNADEYMAAAEPGEKASRGIMGSIKDAAGKIFGGGGAAALLSKLSSLGISTEQAQTFLPQVMEFLKSKLPESVTKQFSNLFPAPHETPA